MDYIIKESVTWLKDNTDMSQVIKNWINSGDIINYRLVREMELTSNFNEIICGLESILDNADIRLKEDLVFLRETTFPDRDISTLMSVSSRPIESFCGCFGDIIYPTLIPKGTKIFYISAWDCLEGRPANESEEEFLIEKGTTQLVDGKLIFKPSLQTSKNI